MVLIPIYVDWHCDSFTLKALFLIVLSHRHQPLITLVFTCDSQANPATYNRTLRAAPMRPVAYWDAIDLEAEELKVETEDLVEEVEERGEKNDGISREVMPERCEGVDTCGSEESCHEGCAWGCLADDEAHRCGT